MSKIERLTDEERLTLSIGGYAAKKALRIIDQLTAALEAAPRFTQFNCAEEFMAGSREDLEARAQALQARTAELGERLDAAESELCDLRGRVERAIEALECLGAPIWMPAAARRALEALRGR